VASFCSMAATRAARSPPVCARSGSTLVHRVNTSSTTTATTRGTRRWRRRRAICTRARANRAPARSSAHEAPDPQTSSGPPLRVASPAAVRASCCGRGRIRASGSPHGSAGIPSGEH
jgi:hypothetical protein